MRRTDLQSAQPFDATSLAFREKWAAILRLPRLTADEQRALDEWRSSQWVPQRALHYMWAHIDPVHGCCSWKWAAFGKAIDLDRAEIDAVTATRSEQADRLGQWLLGVEALARQRNTDSQPAVGEYYERLGALGYDSHYEAHEEHCE